MDRSGIVAMGSSLISNKSTLDVLEDGGGVGWEQEPSVGTSSTSLRRTPPHKVPDFLLSADLMDSRVDLITAKSKKVDYLYLCTATCLRKMLSHRRSI